jgi:hypothetical protein
MQRRPPGAPKQRRSLTQASAGGRIERGGDSLLADGLAAALAAAQREAEIAESLTHPFHTYPARMHPATARHLVALGGAVLDPFCGSGTALVEARRAGVGATGVDLNPLAVAIARAKTWTVPLVRRQMAWSLGREIAAAALDEVKLARRAGYVSAPLRRGGPDPGARNRALAEWFAPHVRRELETLADLVDQAGARDREAGEVLRAVLSSILYKVSQRASDTDPSRVSRQIARGAAARLFEKRLAVLFGGLEQLAAAAGPTPRVVCADARRLGGHVQPGSAELVVTSPPYAGTYDYTEQHRMRMMFLGMDPAGLARGEIGARARFAGVGQTRSAQALADTRQAFAEVFGQIEKALARGGRAAIVLGDSMAGGTAVRGDQIARGAAAGTSLALVAWAHQERTSLGRAEARAFERSPKREHILLFEAR